MTHPTTFFPSPGATSYRKTVKFVRDLSRQERTQIKPRYFLMKTNYVLFNSFNFVTHISEDLDDTVYFAERDRAV